jgi:hypothetical protein
MWADLRSNDRRQVANLNVLLGAKDGRRRDKIAACSGIGRKGRRAAFSGYAPVEIDVYAQIAGLLQISEPQGVAKKS